MALRRYRIGPSHLNLGFSLLDRVYRSRGRLDAVSARRRGCQAYRDLLRAWPMQRGSCLCGAVKFEVACPLPPPDACHCSQCRKQSGHVFASTDVPRSALTLEGGEHVTWFRSSQKVRRGFCSTCGSSLFFDPIEKDWIGVAMGAFDSPTHTRLAIHIFVADKGDYYDIADGLPQNPR